MRAPTDPFTFLYNLCRDLVRCSAEAYPESVLRGFAVLSITDKRNAANKLFSCLLRMGALQHDTLTAAEAHSLAALLLKPGAVGEKPMVNMWSRMAALLRLRQQIMQDRSLGGRSNPGFSPPVLEALCGAVAPGAWDFSACWDGDGLLASGVRGVDKRLAALPEALQAEAASEVLLTLALDTLGNFFSEHARATPHHDDLRLTSV